MILVTTENVPGREIKEAIGIAKGQVVQSKHIGRDFMAGLKTIVGGEIEEYTEMISEAREIVTTRMIEEATRMCADAIVGIRFGSSAIMGGASEMLAYGTAVKLK